MRLLIQRVKEASVCVEENIVGKIGTGLLIFVGIAKGDTQEKAEYLAYKTSNLRIFEDENNKMNLSIKNVGGSALVISQFTLVGDCSRGNRPGFDKAEDPKQAKFLYEYFSDCLKKYGINVENGIFQADMQVSLINDGPCTFLIER